MGNPRRVSILLWPFFFLRHLFHEFAWQARVRVAAGFLGRRKLGKVLKELRKRGISVIPNHFPSSVMDLLHQECDKVLDDVGPSIENLGPCDEGDVILGSGMHVERYSGTIKIKDIRSPILDLVRQDRFMMMVHMIFRLRWSQLPLMIYHVAHDGNMKHPAVPGKTKIMIAGEPHIDSSNHGLKAFTVLDEVKEENGPFTCIERTASKWGLLGYHVRQRMNEWGFKIPPGDSNQINVREMAQLQKQHRTFLATVNPGDLVCFDTRSVHYASSLTKGCRRVLWFYF